jgi:hypothetical protein
MSAVPLLPGPEEYRAKHTETTNEPHKQAINDRND